MRPVDGVTVAICCHDSARLLPDALRRLHEQWDSADLPWEVLVVDNGSNDDTPEVARSCWSRGPVPLRVVGEPLLGVAHARKRALKEAKYDVVSFLDDDNRAACDWVRRVWHIMNEHPRVAACGGRCVPDCEIEPPWWFPRYMSSYALGSLHARAGDVTHSSRLLWGAGLTIRRTAWEELLERGFSFSLDGHVGNSLSSGEDRELCLALRALGWRLWCDPALTLHHHIPKERLEWAYMRRLHRGFGASTVGLDAYSRHPEKRLSSSWRWQALAALAKLCAHSILLAPALVTGLEGSRRVLRLEAQIGRLHDLLKARSAYRGNMARVRSLGKAVRFRSERVLVGSGRDWAPPAAEESR